MLRQRGKSLIAKGQHQDAFRWFRWAGDMEGLGDALMAANAFEKAMDAYAQAGALEKAGEAALKADRVNDASEFFVKCGKVDVAVKALAERGNMTGATQIYLDHGRPLDAAALNEKMGKRTQAARLYAEAGEFDKALSLYRQTANWEKLALVYKMKGDIDGGIAECKRNNELLAAAILCELVERWSDGAALYAAVGMQDRAIALFEKAEDWPALAEIYQSMGRLHLAADAYSKVPGKDLAAAELFEELVILVDSQEFAFEKDVIAGAMAAKGGSALLGAMDRAAHYTDAKFKARWRFSVSGEGLPRAVAISADGKLAAVATESTPGSPDNVLYILNDKKEAVWQKQHKEPFKRIMFLPEGRGIAGLRDNAVVCYGEKGEEAWSVDLDFKPWALTLSPGGDYLVVGTMGGTLYAIDLAGAILSEKKIGERIHSVSVSPDGVNYVVGAGDGKIFMCTPKFDILWELSKGDAFRHIVPLPGRRVIATATLNEINLLNMEGATIYNESMGRRVLTMFADVAAQRLVVALDGGTLKSFGSVDCRQQAAECYARAGEKQRAAEIFQSIEKYQEAYQLYKEVGDFEAAANTLHLTGDTITAARHYEVVGRFDKAAQLYEEVGENYQAAKCYGKANRFHEAARIYEQLNDTILAADFYERAGSSREAGLLFKKANQIERAITCFEDYHEKGEGDKNIIFELGSLYKTVEQYDEAIKMFQMLTDDEKYRRDALQKLGQCFQSKKIYEVALDRFNECLGDNKKPGKENIDVYYDMACTHEQAGNFDEAKKIFGRVMAIDYYYRDVQDRLKETDQMSTLHSQSQVDEMRHTKVIGAEAHASGAVTAMHQRYKIVKKLGEGGMGVVYLANDTLLNREVAWKVLPAHLAGKEDFQQRLLREARAAAKLSHRNIVQIYDIMTNPQECFITMEYINGQPLRNICKSKGRLSVRDTVRYCLQMAEALESAHKAGVVHRDVKPENIMIALEGDEVKMVDFGLARLTDDMNLTMEGCVVGTIPYMAPEQIMAKEIGPHTDLYALGIILFELLAGRVPFTGENVLAQHLHNVPPNVRDFAKETPDPLAMLIDDLLEKEFKERPKGSDVIQQLSALM